MLTHFIQIMGAVWGLSYKLYVSSSYSYKCLCSSCTEIAIPPQSI